MKKKAFLLSLLILFLIGLFSINFVRVRADSGWDSDFDFDFGDSDWGSSWDSDWGSSDYSGGGGNPIIIVIIIVVIIIIIASKSSKNSLNNPNNSNVNKLGNVDVNIPGFNESDFLNQTYKTYIDVQHAWTNFDYDTLQKLLSDELYNSYKSQLKALSLKKQKNLMHDFELVSNEITSFSESEKEYTIKTKMCVKFYDYVVDKDEKVLRGNNKRRIIMTYELTFVKSKADKANKCPNCNAPLDNVASSICPYCNSTIVADYHDFVLSKKQAINQRAE